MPISWSLEEQDTEFFEKELNSFVPDRVFDMHAHLWRKSDWEGSPPEIVLAAPSEMTMEKYKEYIGWILPKRKVHGLHFAYPTIFPNNPGPCNDWVAAQIRKDPLSRGQFYVRPQDDPDWVETQVKRLGMRGFKPFVGFLERPDKNMAEIPEYFPEWLANLANKNAWSVTLHIQRPRSLADDSNLHWIQNYCLKYPNMILILDHCARGFNPYHLIEGLARIDSLHNLYVDTSVTCSPVAIIACVERLGIDHVLFASDYYCSHFRGTNLPVGDSFLWLLENMSIWNEMAYSKKPVLIGLENLRAVKNAFRILRISDTDVEKYFWSNAAQLLNIE